MKKEDEIENVTFMVELYCRKKHGSKKHELCDDCKEVLEYMKKRREKCPWGDDKPFCSNCPIMCHHGEMKERVGKIMMFSGPRMLFYHPIRIFQHMFQSMFQKKKYKKKFEEMKKNRPTK